MKKFSPWSAAAAALALFPLLGVPSASAAPPGPLVISSPNGASAIRIEADASSFSVSRRGETVLAASPLGLELDGAPDYGPLLLEKRDDARIDRIVPLVAAKASEARDNYRGATLVFRERKAPGRRLYVDVRAYDDGVAFRYRIDGSEPVRLRGERTAFVPAGDPECLVSVATGAHEVPFERMNVSQLRAGQAYDVPVVCTAPSGRTTYAITHANLAGYTGESLLPEGGALRVRLSAPPTRPAPAFVSMAGLTTAWRVVMMGDRAGDLIASHLVGNLNPSPQGDFSWVKPGKAAWDWYSGPMAGMKPGMDNYRRFIDFAAAAGLPYYLIDAGWALGSSDPGWKALPGTDITRAEPGTDMPELVRYAATRGVGLMLWAHWEHVAPRMDEVLDTYARWGIKGVKIDFMDRDDQEIVAFYQRIAEATAKRRLLLDLHGAYVPAGLQRSYPHFLTQEGVMGAEWNKMGKKITPRHNLMLPYTRMLAGPIDYTPGGFRNGTPATFAVHAEKPMTQTTRGQALAMYVVYDSPLQMVSDDPDAYRDAPGFDFIQRVPTAWDETRFLSGEPGRDIMLARRKGSSWYVGAMTADEAAGGRVAPLALDFLAPGRYRATVWEDGASPNDVVRTAREVAAGDVLQLRLASAGGAAVILEPLSGRKEDKEIAWGGRAQWGDLGDGRYRNPVLPADYSDLDAIRVGDDYYAISSTFQFSPGMAILHSRDLVNWQTVGHAVPDLTQISPELNWDRMNRYGRGIWAGAIRHHAGRYWIYFGTPEEGYFMTSADRPEGPWAPLHRMLPAAGLDDCAPFWDDDGKGYFIGTNFKDGYKIHLWEMSADNKTLIPGSDQVIYQSKGSEANKLYKFNGVYYHFFSEVQGDTRVMMMRRASSIRGPWSGKRQLMHGDLASRQPNQGGIVQGPDSKWYFFTHHGDGAWEGRVASLLPVHWMDGWPVIGRPGADGVGAMVWEGSMPAAGSARQFPQGGDNFDAGALSPVWEWNYQPRMDKWSMSARPGFMRLHAFAGLDGGNLLKVGNVLTQRVVRGVSQAFAARLELKGMADGQHAGLAHFTAQPRAANAAESTASAGVVMAGGRRYLEVSRDGSYTRLQPWPHDAIWLRSGWGMDGKATLSVSADGRQFAPVVADFALTWGAYRGSRIGLFTFNPVAEQGYVDVDTVNYDIGAAAARTAPKPLYRDPVYDGAADASIVYDRAAGLWKMFYTNRRATVKLPDLDDVGWVHGTAIGIASSPDGVQWQYQGTADFPKACTDVTQWAPDIYYENGIYHMWLTIVPGIFHRWGEEGAEGRIEHLTSTDLAVWKCEGTVTLDTGRMIDPTVVKLGQGYRMWYKDERAGSRILAADSRDLRNWTKVSDQPVNPTKGEGAKVFRFKGHYWLIADVWKGLMVLRSDDALNWTEQPGYILGQPGLTATDRHKGQHADVVVDSDRAFIYYFVHQENEAEAAKDPRWSQRTVIQVAELVYRDGKLLVDRDADLSFRLHAPPP